MCVTLGGEGWEDAVEKHRDRSFGTGTAVLLHLAEDFVERAALDDEPVDADPGRGPVVAAVAVDQDRPGLGILGQRQRFVEERVGFARLARAAQETNAMLARSGSRPANADFARTCLRGRG